MTEKLQKEAFKKLELFFAPNKMEPENTKILSQAKDFLKDLWTWDKKYNYFVFEESLKGKDINYYFAFEAKVPKKDHYSYCKFFYSESSTKKGFVYRLLANNNCDTGCCPTHEIFKITEKFKPN
jgi:hypothetical protein